MKKNKRKSKKRAIAPARAVKLPPFDARRHIWLKVLQAYALLGFISTMTDAVQLSPTMSRLASKFLAFVEWPWRIVFDVLGMKFISEVAVMMSCFIAITATAISAMSLEKKHAPAPAWVGVADKEKRRRLFDAWWSERYVQGVFMASVATASFVIATDCFALGNSFAASVTRIPIWYWVLHALALFLCLPLLVMRHDVRRLAELIAVGLLCGLGVFLIWLPSASRAVVAGGGETDYFRHAVLDYSVWRLTITLAALLSLASPPFMLARLAPPVALAGFFVLVAGLATVRAV